MLFYTDGVTESEDDWGELFGTERLCTLVQSMSLDLSAPALVDGILDGVRAFVAARSSATI